MHLLAKSTRIFCPPTTLRKFIHSAAYASSLILFSASLEKLVVPQVTLTGIDSNGLQVNASLNTGEASFVSGVFAQEATVTKANVQTPIQTLVVASDAPFVLPGQNILIFPIGAIITGAWAVLLIGTIGYGTFGRMQFRDQYRRRSARATKGDLARI